MNLSVTTQAGDQLVSLQVGTDSTVATLKTLVAAELGVVKDQHELFFRGAHLEDTKTLSEYGIQNHDMLEVRKRIRGAAPRAQGASLAEIPQDIANNPQLLFEYIKASPNMVQELLQKNALLAEAVLSDNFEIFSMVLNQQAQQRATARREQQQKQHEEAVALAQLNADPMNPEAQAKIAEMIRKKNVEENMEMAIEYNPESFGRVVMLYVPMTVNGHRLSAFVDSGAQSTIMSVECARRCGIMRLVDQRFSGVAKGVGTAKIVGRVHQVAVQFGNKHFGCSFTILEQNGMELLFGLDQLRRHQACIDLKSNCLRIGGQEIKFLQEKDLPREGEELTADEKKMISPEPASSSSSSSSSVAASSSASAPSVSSAPVPSPAAAAQPISMPSVTATTRPTWRPAQNPWANLRPEPPTATPRPAAASGMSPGGAGVSQLMALGFARSEAIQALTAANGDVNVAASMLLMSRGPS